MPSTPTHPSQPRSNASTSAEQPTLASCERSRKARTGTRSSRTMTCPRRAVLNADGEPTTHGGVRGVRVKMIMEVMGKLEQYLDEDCRHTCEQMCDRLRSDLGVFVSTSSVHRALQGMV
ncbi:hypothetical protein PC129_g18608 [Phytophthora cactorum]|uniref:Uncharacterized protein n=1 Tax=Phytophthora cactorum TaxID=29920 RepID=A0A8T0YA23_9STRA|nr:hypothetical protein Pcac1_g22769 [Phytophthora cactorum]KAG2805428.1 hypothetical protein PC111_g17816 [Phytophthora cactorum]KAG2819595.1 hypothetical protein PC112_g12129 [Phytophthora cactorum]KAG2846878.1 hypothetical protein PC113_g17885 [Phytophthora cactorum]KAG2881349.1 hypothetical protein PC114_g21608 [Phytophthora cactorum]